MNTMNFQELAKGKYGRQVAYANVEYIDASNIIKVLGNVIGIHDGNKRLIEYLWNYKNGDQPVLYRTKVVRDDLKPCNVVENRAWEIVRFKNGQTYGEPIQFVSTVKDETVNKNVERLNNYFRIANSQRVHLDSGEWTSATGSGYIGVQLVKGGKKPFRLVSLNPMNTFVVYATTTREALMSVQELKDVDGHFYFHCFTDTHEYKIQDNKIVYEGLHTFGAIPIVEYPNNQNRISDIELVITMLDAINEMQSNRMDAVVQFVESFFKFVNCEIDSETFGAMKQLGAFVIKSNNGDNKADVDIMSQEMNQQQNQVVKDDLWDSVLSIEAIPNRSEGSGDRQGGTYLKNGWDFSKQSAQLKDAYIKESEMCLVESALNCIRIEKGENECKLELTDFDVQINHSPLDNLFVKVESLQMLLSSGIHPLVAIRTIPLWGDAQEVYNMSKPYLDVLYKEIDQAIDEQNLQGQLDQAKQMIAENNAKNQAIDKSKDVKNVDEN